MNKKLLGIFVCMLLIAATALPVAGTIEIGKIKMENNRNSVTIQPPEEWNNTFGGTDLDVGYAVQLTSDGGYIIAGSTVSYGAGDADAWLIKTDSNGDEQWNKTFGGAGVDYGVSVRLTSNGGYVLVGWTESYGAGGGDAWLIKTDASGNEQWNKTFGGTEMELGYSVQQTTDSGFIITGFTESYGTVSWDAWLIKTDSNGDEQWNKTFGGTEYDFGYSVQQTTDGGYVITGGTASYGAGDSDVWLIKTDSNGDEQWNKTFGGSSADQCYSVQQTTDGGYVITGITMSYGTGDADAWLIKTDSNGDEQWNKTFGGTGDDRGVSIKQTTDGGYIITGATESFGAGGYDVWLIKTDSNGDEQWNKTFGGTDLDVGYAVQLTSDGGYIIAGGTVSYGAGDADAWLIKVASENQPPNAPTINGETNGKAGTEYEYTFNATDPDGDDVKYFIDWGDNNTEWTGYNPSGTDVKVKHTWSDKGTYMIKAKAVDMYGAESDWGALEVEMPKNKAFNFNFNLLEWLFERFPNAFPLLRYILDL